MDRADCLDRFQLNDDLLSNDEISPEPFIEVDALVVAGYGDLAPDLEDAFL